MPVFRLNKEDVIFPSPRLAEDNGLLAVGGIIGGLFTAAFEKMLNPGKAYTLLLLCAFCACMMGVGMLLPEQTHFLKYLILS